MRIPEETQVPLVYKNHTLIWDSKHIIKMSSVMLFTFNNIALFTVTVHGNPWSHAREVCRAREYGKATKTADIVKKLCSQENYTYKRQLTEFASATNFMDWPKDSRKDDYYINEEEMYELFFSSQQTKAKKLGKHCCNVIFQHIGNR